MNDRLKFRVYLPDENRYMHNTDCPVIDSSGKLMWCYLTPFGHWEHYPMENAVVEQYTGLKDKSGKLIFEGDVLGFYINVHPVYVQWDFSKCRFVLRRFDVEGWEISLIQDTAPRYTVIGNIHEMEVTK